MGKGEANWKNFDSLISQWSAVAPKKAVAKMRTGYMGTGNGSARTLKPIADTDEG